MSVLVDSFMPICSRDTYFFKTKKQYIIPHPFQLRNESISLVNSHDEKSENLWLKADESLALVTFGVGAELIHNHKKKF